MRTTKQKNILIGKVVCELAHLKTSLNTLFLRTQNSFILGDGDALVSIRKKIKRLQKAVDAELNGERKAG